MAHLKKVKRLFISIASFVLALSIISITKVDAKNANYMRVVDKKHQRYDYHLKNNELITYAYPSYSKKNKLRNWQTFWNGIGDAFEKQNSKGYFASDTTYWEITFDAPVLKFPVKKNLTWKVGKEQRKILKTKTSVKTKYKTFKNAVKVQVGNSSAKHYQYFVPKFGMVKETKKGKSIFELVNVE